MADLAGVGGIEPAAAPSSLERDDFRGVNRSPIPLASPSQEVGSRLDVEVEYYDIMIVGMTGQGKSTTCDKLIISKPVLGYPGRVDTVEDDGDDVKVKDKKLSVKNLTFWMISRIPQPLEVPITKYLKDLELFGGLGDPHLEINLLREDGDINPITSTCQLISNDITNIRVLDVPGFFSVQPGQAAVSLEEESDRCTRKHLALMRELLRVQSTMRLRFSRIMYFLPVRGPLERPSEVLMLELRLMARYFGRSVFDSMVLVATAQTRLSKIPEMQEQLFTDDESGSTRMQFQKALRSVLVPSHITETTPLPNPPLVFISMMDTCEAIVEKVKTARVREEALELSFDPGVCIKCNSGINSLKGERVEVVREFPNDRVVVSYEESLCHPIFLPRADSLQEILTQDGTVYVVIRRSSRRQPDTDALAETCPSCGRAPGTEGCMQVGSKYEMAVKGESVLIPVDHSNQLEEHRSLRQVKREETGIEASDTEEEMGGEDEEEEVRSSRVAMAADTGGDTSELVGVRVTVKRHHERRRVHQSSEPDLADVPDMKG